MAHTSVSPSSQDDVSSSVEHNKLPISHNHHHHHHSYHPNSKLVQEDVQSKSDNVDFKSTGEHHVVPTKTTDKKALSVSMSTDLVPQQPPPPDGGWGWFVVFGSFMIHVVTDGLVYSIGIFHDEFLIYFGESKGKTAWIASLLTGMILCSGPLCSVFVNKYGCRAVTIAGAILASISLFASAWAPNVFTLFITVGLGTGFGFGLIYLPAIVSVTCYFEKYRSLATGIAVCGAGVGTFIFSPLNDYLIKNYGWRGAFIILSAMLLNCVAFGALFKPLEPEKQPKKAVLEKPSALPSKTTDKLDLCVKYEVSGGMCSACGYTATNHKNGPTPDTFIPSIFLAKFTESNANSFGRGRIMSCPNILYPGSLENVRHYSQAVIPENCEEAVRLNSSTKNPANGLDPKIESKEKKNWIKKIKNLGFLVDPIFILFILSNFFTSLGFNVPYIYIVSQARSKGIDEDKLNYLLSVMGIANTVGRIILGFISDKPWVNRLFLYNLCLTICGLVTMMSVFCKTFFEFTLYSVIFGASAGAYVGLTSVVLVDLLGLQHLTNAFGILLLFEGFASFIGPPIAGFFYDQTASYDPGFYAAGLLIAISGLMLFFVPCVRKSLRRKSNEQKRTELINSIG